MLFSNNGLLNAHKSCRLATASIFCYLRGYEAITGEYTGDLTINEQRTHFAAWVFLKSPILLGTNVRLLSRHIS